MSVERETAAGRRARLNRLKSLAQPAPQDAGGLDATLTEVRGVCQRHATTAHVRAEEGERGWLDVLHLLDRVDAAIAVDRDARDRAHEDEVAAAVMAEQERIAGIIERRLALVPVSLSVYGNGAHDGLATAARLARADRSAT